MRAINLQVIKVLLALLCCFGASAVAAEQDDKATNPPTESGTPEIQPKTRVKLGGISLGGFYRRYSNFDYSPYYYPYTPGFWGVPPYSPWPYPDFSTMPYPPGYDRSFSRSEGMGEVKLQTSERTAEVFLDGAYAGVADDLKSIWLEPGAYTLEVKGRGSESFKKRIYVLSGKTVRVSAVLTPEAGEARQ